MKKYVMTLSILLFTITANNFADPLLPKSPLSSGQSVQQLDSIIATVNNNVILKSTLDQQIKLYKKNLAGTGASIPKDSVIRKKILDQLIDKELIIQAAKRMDIQVSNKEIDVAITQIAKNNKITKEKLYQSLEEQGLTIKTFRAELHDQILVQKLQEAVIAPKIKITEQDMKKFIQTYQKMTAAYHLLDIVVPYISESAKNGEVKQQAEKVLNLLQKSKQFDPSILQPIKVQANDLGSRLLNQMPPIFAENVLEMQVGNIKGPIEAPNGFHIIKLIGVKKQKTSTGQAKEMLFQKKLQEETQKFLKTLRKEGYVKIY